MTDDDDRPATPEEMSAAIRAISATAQRLMGERDALAGALRPFAALRKFASGEAHFTALPIALKDMDAACAALAQLDSVAPPLTPND